MRNVVVRCVTSAALIALLMAGLAGQAASAAAARGVPADRETALDGQVVGGHPSGERPGVVALLHRAVADPRDALLCSGSLVHSRWVLTAAHCLEGFDADDLDVLVGTLDLTAGGERISVDRAVEHPAYEARRDGWFADIALLRLDRPADASTVSLAGPGDWSAWAPGAALVVLGWGLTEEGVSPARLHAATLPAERPADCVAALGDAFDPATMLCGGPEGVGICVGDSGGPLLAGGKAVQVGVASAGSAGGCGLAEPDTYTDVTAFGGWIRATTEGAVPAAPAAAVRLSGDDRYATAAAVSRHTFGSGQPVVYVASGEDFPDGLAAGPVVARRGGPLLLTRRDALPDATANELARLAPERIVVVGGRGAVGDAIVRALEDSAPTERIGGDDRYTTAVELSRDWPGTPTHVVLATGDAFPDALAGVSLAARVGPMLLTKPESLPAVTAARIAELRPETVIILGGEQAVSRTVEEVQLPSVAPDAEVRRLSGTTRYATAAAIAGDADHWPDPRLYYVATGTGFADALAGGVAAAVHGAPLLLTLPEEAPESLRAAAAVLRGRPVLLGGPGSVADPIARELDRAFQR